MVHVEQLGIRTISKFQRRLFQTDRNRERTRGKK
jgi:hypothetical protein